MKGAEQEIVGRSVIMRPYLWQFVEKYHTWMVRLHSKSMAVSGIISPIPIIICRLSLFTMFFGRILRVVHIACRKTLFSGSSQPLNLSPWRQVHPVLCI